MSPLLFSKILICLFPKNFVYSSIFCNKQKEFMEIHNFFIQLVLILLSARFLGELAAKHNVPSIIGELFAGVLLGPSLLGLIEPNDTIKLLANIGIILLLFEVGLETDISRLAQTKAKPFIVACAGVIVPFVLGFIVSYVIFDFDLLVSLFVGGTLTATSIGITIRVLADLGKKTSHEAQIVLGAAVIDDIIGIVILSILYEFSIGEGIELTDITKIIFFILLYLILAPIIFKLLSFVIQHYEEKSEIPGLLPSSIVAIVLLFSWIAHYIGAPELLGGFAAGLALSRQFILPFKTLKVDEEFYHKVESQMKPIVYLFTPIFFVSVGLSLNLKEIPWESPFIWTLSLSFLFIAIIGKIFSGLVLFTESKWTQWAVGLAMVPRGEVGLIFAEIGRKGKIFNNEIYAAMIIVIAITTIFTPFAMRIFYDYQRKYLEKK
ncbi:putative Na(+)/H(+) antiporter [Chlamydiales bacterium STE3]|nr:putative Na(+)/H(+) antiporter [Chlamydiales bacterium STE3]